jgi:hypothetical protein
MFLSQIGCPTVWASDIGDEVDGTNKDLDADGMGASRDRRRGPLETLKSNLQISEFTDLADTSEYCQLRMDTNRLGEATSSGHPSPT